MTYFTTMNLPAPPHERFEDYRQRYESAPARAVRDFEAALCRFFEVEAVTTFTNCFTAIAMALLYATRTRPKTVAVAGLAYRRTTDIVMWAGLRPIYVDNDPRTLCMSPARLEETLKAGGVGCVLMQQPMVNICDPRIYVSLCRDHGVPLVLDSVEATGGACRGVRIGGFGVVEAFSLHPSKVINAAEGGVLTFGRASEHRNFLEFMRDLGIIEADLDSRRFFGLEPVHAMMGLASLEAYPAMRAKFRTHYLKYQERLQDARLFRLVDYDLSADPNFKSVLVELQTEAKDFRTALLAYLEPLGIGARSYYAPLHPMVQNEDLPEASRLSERYVFLPIGHSVTVADVDFICDKLIAYEASVQGG